MKGIKITLKTASFIFTFIIPILLLGIISPLVRGEMGAGLTGLGYIALACTIIVCAIKLLGRVLKMKKGWKRALLISAFPISLWLVVMLGINYVQAILLSISNYWMKVGIFIIIGRIFDVIGECLEEYYIPGKNTSNEEKLTNISEG